MAAIETLIDAIANWFRDLLLGILGRHAEEILAEYVRRKRKGRNAKVRKLQARRKSKCR